KSTAPAWINTSTNSSGPPPADDRRRFQVPEEIVMDYSWKARGKFAVATLVAAAFLTSAFVSARPSKAGSPPGQVPAKIEEKAVDRIEIKKAMPAGVRVEVKEAAVVKVGKAAQVNAEAMSQRYAQQLRP